MKIEDRFVTTRIVDTSTHTTKAHHLNFSELSRDNLQKIHDNSSEKNVLEVARLQATDDSSHLFGEYSFDQVDLIERLRYDQIENYGSNISSILHNQDVIGVGNPIKGYDERFNDFLESAAYLYSSPYTLQDNTPVEIGCVYDEICNGCEHACHCRLASVEIENLHVKHFAEDALQTKSPYIELQEPNENSRELIAHTDIRTLRNVLEWRTEKEPKKLSRTRRHEIQDMLGEINEGKHLSPKQQRNMHILDYSRPGLLLDELLPAIESRSSIVNQPKSKMKFTPEMELRQKVARQRQTFERQMRMLRSESPGMKPEHVYEDREKYENDHRKAMEPLIQQIYEITG